MSLYISLLKLCFFFLYFKLVCNCSLKHFVTTALKSLSDGSDISIISVLASANCLFSCSLRSSWFLVWWVIFDWNLGNFVFCSETLDYVLASFFWHSSDRGRGGEVLADYWEVEVEVQVLLSAFVDTWRWVKSFLLPDRSGSSSSLGLITTEHWWNFWLSTSSPLTPSQQGGREPLCYCLGGHRNLGSPCGFHQHQGVRGGG